MSSTQISWKNEWPQINDFRRCHLSQVAHTQKGGENEAEYVESWALQDERICSFFFDSYKLRERLNVKLFCNRTEIKVPRSPMTTSDTMHGGGACLIRLYDRRLWNEPQNRIESEISPRSRTAALVLEAHHDINGCILVCFPSSSSAQYDHILM